MSSFIVGAKHMKSIEVSLIDRALKNQPIFSYKNRTIEGIMGMPLAYMTRNIQTRIRDIYIMNINSVNIQYKQDNNYNLLADCIQSENGKLLNDYELIKAIQCLLYQIETVTDNTLYDFFQSIQRRICECIVMNTPEYDRASWGID